MSRFTFALLVIVLTLPSVAHAQFAPSAVAYPYPVRPPAGAVGGLPARLEPPPPLFIRFDGPTGMEITFYRGGKKGETLTVPFTVGLRPGFAYRLQATGGTLAPGVTIYPTLEVRGSLVGRKVRVQDHPATLTITAEDLESVAGVKVGSDPTTAPPITSAKASVVTRVLTLERPETAEPAASSALVAREYDAGGHDPIEVAASRGVPLAIMRIGQRAYTEQELLASGQSGTILLPHEKVLAAPKTFPYLPWYCLDLYDPILGPRPFAENYCLPDGGDTGIRAGFGPDGKLAGIDPTDAIAQYEDSRGRKHVVASNRVCVCVPRFIVIRHELATSRHFAETRLKYADRIERGDAMTNRYHIEAGHQQTRLEALNGQTRLSSNRQLAGPAVYGQFEGLDVSASISGTRNVTGTLLGPEEGDNEDGPLQLFKWPECTTALIGQIVTFYLRYTNRGGRPIRNVVVVDSLGPRYEYVPGSARSDRDGLFTTETNEAGSLLLRWEIGDALPAGANGVVSFQVRIR